VVDGEALALLHRDPDGLRLQLLDPSQLDRSLSRDLGDGRAIVSGVEMDARGRATHYHVLNEQPGSTFLTATAPERLPASDVLHVFCRRAAGQARGISWLAPAVLAAKELDELLDAALVASKTSALLSAWLVNQNDMSGGHPFEEGEPLSLEPGTVRTLPGGWDVKFLEPESLKELPQHARLHMQRLAAALGLPEHLLTGDLTQANYSSLRAGLLPFRQRMESIQYGTLAPQFLRPVWRAWAGLELVAGRLDVNPEAPVEWLMPRVPQVDPAKDLEATETALRLGLTSRSQAVAELGWSAEALDEEIQADREREAGLGLNFSTNGDGNAE
jgi:lambda family phage portal protein